MWHQKVSGRLASQSLSTKLRLEGEGKGVKCRPESTEWCEVSHQLISIWAYYSFGDTALGTGLNFPNVSHVVIYGAPGDLEAIVQQVGRTGRHGQPSHAILYDTRRYYKVVEEVKEL